MVVLTPLLLLSLLQLMASKHVRADESHLTLAGDCVLNVAGLTLTQGFIGRAD